ncbi:MAG: HD-GYP domain-containing protein [Nitrosomonadales bacterium]|nr:HD-GYP domain-containing protein [Nitrosomonadales bacterium]
MLKRIEIKQLVLGMYINEFCGSWMDHPFWRGAFLLDNPKDMEAILATGIREVWIDDAKGLGVQDGQQEETIAAEVEATLEQADTPGKIIRRVDTAQEAERAVKICAKSKQAVTSMFHEARMGKALSGNDALPIVDEISTSVMRNPGALIGLARLKDKDDYTYMHSVAVCALMVSLGRQLGLSNEKVRDAGLAGLLHDIGKMMISPSILNKPGKLTDAEFEIVKSHPVEGHKMLLAGSDVCEMALDVGLHHHEKMDGSGYPERLADGQISLYAKMGAVCDVYDAITSNRPYKNGWEPAESIRKMAEWKGHFDPAIFQAFVKNMGIYPIGSMVKLSSNRLAVIIEQSEKSLLTPIVKVFFSIKSNGRIIPEIIDLSKPACKEKIVSHEDPVKWDIRDIHELWSGIAATVW